MLNKYSQRDPRWSEMRLGKSSNPTVGEQGCLVTAIAIGSGNTGTEDFDPMSLVKKLGDGGFIEGGLLLWVKAAEAMNCRFGYRYDVSGGSGHERISEGEAWRITWHLHMMGIPVLLHVDTNGDGSPNHWVTTDPTVTESVGMPVGIASQQTAIPIIDPWDGKALPFVDRYRNVCGLAYFLDRTRDAADGWKAAVLSRTLSVADGEEGSVNQLLWKLTRP